MKKQIEFDFSKWGQEGISVKTDMEVLNLYKNDILNNFYYGIDINGVVFSLPEKHLKMYQETKPREIWVNEQQDAIFHYSKVFASKKEAESQKLPFVIRTIKFREVEDEQ